MQNKLLNHYNEELATLRQMGSEFAKKHPKIAGRLKIGDRASEDPFVERMIEAFAFMNARMRNKLEDDFPELINGMFDQLYPHYLAPIPSISILKINHEGLFPV